jgi:hypothetical protein
MTRKTVWTNADGLKVGFGPRDATYTDAGKLERRGDIIEHVVLDIRGSKFVDGVYTFDSDVAIPVGASPESAMVEVSEAFVIGGTDSPGIAIGTDGTGGGAVFGTVAEASAEALGTYVNTVTATPLTSTTAGKLKVALVGTNPTVTAAGKMKIVLRYRVI